MNITNTDNVHSFVSRFINDIKGFDIKLGVWIENSDNGLELFNRLLPYKHNFILGTRGEFKTKEYTPTWRTNGDIEDKEYVNLDFLREPILRLGIYSDYVSIYDENKFAPILSTHKYD